MKKKVMIIMYAIMSLQTGLSEIGWYGVEKGGGGSVKRHQQLFIQTVEPSLQISHFNIFHHHC